MKPKALSCLFEVIIVLDHQGTQGYKGHSANASRQCWRTSRWNDHSDVKYLADHPLFLPNTSCDYVRIFAQVSCLT